MSEMNDDQHFDDGCAPFFDERTGNRLTGAAARNARLRKEGGLGKIREKSYNEGFLKGFAMGYLEGFAEARDIREEHEQIKRTVEEMRRKLLD